MADSGRAGQRSRKDAQQSYLGTRKATRDLGRLQMDDDSEPDDDVNDADFEPKQSRKTASKPMPPPARQFSRRSSNTTAAQPRKVSSSSTEGLPMPKLPEGVTPEMVKANLDRIQQSRQSRAPPAHAVAQVDIDPNTLPCGLSVFCNGHLVTRELIFNLSRLDSMQTIKAIVNTYFAYEFKRISLPSNSYFAGITCIYHRSDDPKDSKTFGTFITDCEYQLIHAEIADGKTTTGQLLRIQVALYTDAQLAKDQEQLKDWFAAGEYDVMKKINGLEWIMNFTDTDDRYNDTRIFELDQDHSQTITVPAHTWRQNVEKARTGQMSMDHLSDAYAAKANIRNKEYEIRKEMYAEIRGLRRMLRKTGATNIQLEEVLENARDAEDTERGGRVLYTGETQDFERMKELRKEVEEKGDRANTTEGAAFERAFRNIRANSR